MSDTTRISTLETTVGDVAAYLDELRVALTFHESTLGTIRLKELEQKISPSLAPPGIPRASVGQGAVADSFGSTLTPSTPQVILPSAPGSMTSGTTILPTSSVVQVTCPGDINLLVNSAPTVPDGADGQTITILNLGPGTLALADQTYTAGTNLRLDDVYAYLPPLSSIRLMFSANVGDWVQTGAVASIYGGP